MYRGMAIGSGWDGDDLMIPLFIRYALGFWDGFEMGIYWAAWICICISYIEISFLG